MRTCFAPLQQRTLQQRSNLSRPLSNTLTTMSMTSNPLSPSAGGAGGGAAASAKIYVSQTSLQPRASSSSIIRQDSGRPEAQEGTATSGGNRDYRACASRVLVETCKDTVLFVVLVVVHSARRRTSASQNESIASFSLGLSIVT